MKKILLLGITFLLCSCAPLTPQQKYARALGRASKTDFSAQPALYATLRDRGDITPSQYNDWMQQWMGEAEHRKRIRTERELAFQKEQARARREWESMTPYQRKQIEAQQQAIAIQQQQFAWQQQQAREAEVERALQNVPKVSRRQADMNQQDAQSNFYQMQPVGSSGIPMIDRPQYRVTGQITPPIAPGLPAQFNGNVQ